MVHSTPYTSGTGLLTDSQTAMILIGGALIPGVPSWAGQIQNWSANATTGGTGQIIYLYIRFKVDSATDQPFIVQVDDSDGALTRGFYPNGGCWSRC